MPEEGRNCGCGCGNNNGVLGGLFGGDGCCNSEILFFIIVFLLVFTHCGCCGRN